jgi:cyclopropane-fatty-acyl-phospholipid synthase
VANETLSDPGSVRHAPAGAAVADAVAPLFETLLGGDAPIRVEFWDGSSIDRPRAVATLRVRSPNALRRVLWMPNDLGWGRAYVSGELDLEGDIFAALEALRTAAAQHGPVSPRVLPTTLAAARRVGAIGPPLPPPPEEVRVHGRRHSPGRDS